MKKVTLFLICLVFLPSITSAYVPTDAELKSSIYNYIGNESQRQLYQDILDKQNNSYNQLFDSYYQSLDSLEKEYQLKLKEIELEKDSKKREELWQKEKAVLDKELELIRKENELKKREESIGKPVNSGIDWDQAMKEAMEAVEKSREIEEKSEIKNTTSTSIKPPREIKPYQYEKERSLEDILNDKDSTSIVAPLVVEPVKSPEPRQSIFKRIWLKFVSFF